jgi:hypothetical protein
VRCLGRIIAFLILIMVVIILPCSIWSIAIWDIGTEPTTYTDTLDSEVYDRIAPLWLPAFATIVSEENEDARELRVIVHVIQEMDDEEWERTSAAIVPPRWVEEEMQRNLGGIFTYLHADTDELAIILNTQPVRDRLQGDGADLLVQQLVTEINTWDQCSQTELDDFTAFFNEQTNHIPTCQPGPLMASRIEDGLYTGVDRLVLELPADGRFDLREQLVEADQTTPNEYDGALQEMRRSFVMTDHALPIMIIVPISLIALIVIFAVRTGKEFFLWVGLSLIISAFFSIAPLFSWLYTLTQPIQDATTNSDSLSTLGTQAVVEITRDIAGGLTTPILGVTFLMVVVGFVFLVLSSILTSPQAQQVQQIYYVPSSSTPPPTPIPQPIEGPSGSTASRSDLPAAEASVTPPPVEQPSQTAANPNVPSGDTQTFVDDLTFVPLEDTIEDDDDEES